MARDWRDYLTKTPVEGVVALLSSASGQNLNLMTVSWFAESSHVPPLVRVCVARDSLTHEFISVSGFFGLSLLAADQHQLAIECGRVSGRLQNKAGLPGLEWRHDLAEVPLITSCRAVSFCRVVERLDVGEHTVFVGDILDAWRETKFDALAPLRVSDLKLAAGLR